jgi:hypothetical protein
MAASTAEHATVSKESEGTRHETVSAPHTPQPLTEPDAGLSGRVFGGAPAQPPVDKAAQLLSSRAFSGSVNSAIRLTAVQRAQRTYGNRFVQRIANRVQQTSSARGHIQRHCACGGTCEECRRAAADNPPAVDFGPPESGRLVQTQPASSAGPGSPTALNAELIPAESVGKPMDETTRHFMEPRFGAEFGGVRVHTDNPAERSAEALEADAYTSGKHIYFAAGKYAPETSEGRHLLAHELTHTLQQENGRMSAATSREGGILVGSPTDPLEREAEHVAEVVEQGKDGTPEISGDGASAIRRDVGSVAGAVWDATGGRVVSAVGEVWDAAKETAAAFIERLAPGVLPLLRNAGAFLYEKITSGVDNLFSGIASRVQKQGVIGAITGILSEIGSSIGKSVGALAAGSCHSMVEAASSIIHFVKQIAGETFAELGQIAKSVGDFFSEIWNDFGAPALDALKKVAGEAWNWIKDKAQWLWDKLLPIRNAVGTAWDWVKKEFNIGKEEATGLLDWLFDKAKEQWMKVREKIAPILGPLKIVAGVLLLISPLGPIIAIWKGAPYLWQALQWVWANGIKPQVEMIRAEFREHILPRILEGVDAITTKLDEASAFLCGHAAEISTGLHSLEEALSGFSLLKLASRMVGFAAAFFDNLGAKGKCKFSDVIAEVKSVLRHVYQFVKPILELLRQSALVMVFGPWAILDDGVWKTLNQFIAFAKKTPCIREIAGLLHLDGVMATVGEVRATLKDIWQVVSDQAKFEAAIHQALDGMLARIPGQAETVLGAIEGLDGPHLDVLLKRFLAPKLAKVISSAPQMLIDMVWGLVWPWPGVMKECDDIEKQVGKLKASLWDFEFSKAIDAGLAIWRGVNGVVGLLYGWFFLASVLIGAVFGAPEAGAAVAYQVGEILLFSTIAAETLSIDKAKLNLMSNSRLAKPKKEREKEDDEDYETITGSAMNLAILGAMAVLGEMAAGFAKAVFAEIKGIFLPEGAEAPKLEVPAKTPEPVGEPEPAPKDSASKLGEPAAKELPKETTATAEKNGIPRERLEAEVTDLRQKASSPDNIRRPADGRFDAEMDAEGHAFDRNKADRSWCRRSTEVCGLDLGGELNSKVDAGLNEKPSEAPKELPGEKPPEPVEHAEAADAKRAELQKELSDLQKTKAEADAKWNELGKKAEENAARAKELDRQAAIAKGDAKIKLREEWQQARDAAKDASRESENAFKDAVDAQKEIQKKTAQLNTDAQSKLPCFASGTVVWTSEGPRAIEDLAVNDLVLAYDFECRSVVQRRILEVHRNRTMRFHHIEVSGTEVLATSLHRFWVESEGDWIEARSLHPGMELRTASGEIAIVGGTEVHESPLAATFNLHIEEAFTYFVGPGVLVHNAGGPAYNFGKLRIYEGVNTKLDAAGKPKFPNEIYIGQTDDLERRQGEHRATAEEKLKDPNLTPEEREFWEFKKDIVLKERVAGLNADQANYLEQKNIDIERQARGENNLMNQREQVARENMVDLEQKIKADPKVQDAGLCP